MKYWTDAINPVIGCRQISDGCRNCWALAMARRGANNPNEKIADLFDGVATEHGWTGRANFDWAALDKPSRWRRPRVVAVNWLGDLFRSDVPYEWAALTFDAIMASPQHTYLVLTKRPANMASFARQYASGSFIGDFPSNVWFGVSVESDAHRARVIDLLDPTAPYACRWVSAEPLLGSLGSLPLVVDADGRDATGHDDGSGRAVSLVIAGPETGPGSRRPRQSWFDELADRCDDVGTHCVYKPTLTGKNEWDRLPWRDKL